MEFTTWPLSEVPEVQPGSLNMSEKLTSELAFRQTNF